MIKNKNVNQQQIKIQDNYLPLYNTLEPTEMNLINIDDVFDKYPFITTEMGWTKQDIELFFESHLILGEQKNGVLFVDTETFEMLIEYHRKLNHKDN